MITDNLLSNVLYKENKVQVENEEIKEDVYLVLTNKAR